MLFMQEKQMGQTSSHEGISPEDSLPETERRKGTPATGDLFGGK